MLQDLEHYTLRTVKERKHEQVEKRFMFMTIERNSLENFVLTVDIVVIVIVIVSKNVVMICYKFIIDCFNNFYDYLL